MDVTGKKAERKSLKRDCKHRHIYLIRVQGDPGKASKTYKEKEEVLDLQTKQDKSEDIARLQSKIDSINKELAKVELADHEKG